MITIRAAEQEVRAARRRRAVNSCGLKLMIIYRILRIKMKKELMRRIQARVEYLMHHNDDGVDCALISVDLVNSLVEIKEQVKFESGKAIIKPESFDLMNQLAVCKKCISQTCLEFNVPNMHWRVEGHTAVSKKSIDGGMGTSTDRAKAVCDFLASKGIDQSFLHPEGCGCFRPPPDKKADPRRVEVHVLSPEDVEELMKRKAK
jgi:outer membrane protein OmpA-like peptidoglycan-associated protein